MKSKEDKIFYISSILRVLFLTKTLLLQYKHQILNNNKTKFHSHHDGVFYFWNNHIWEVFTLFHIEMIMIYLFRFMSNISTFFILLNKRFFPLWNDQIFLLEVRSQFKINSSTIKLTADLIDVKWIIRRPSEIILIFLIICSFVIWKIGYRLDLFNQNIIYTYRYNTWYIN